MYIPCAYEHIYITNIYIYSIYIIHDEGRTIFELQTIKGYRNHIYIYYNVYTPMIEAFIFSLFLYITVSLPRRRRWRRCVRNSLYSSAVPFNRRLRHRTMTHTKRFCRGTLDRICQRFDRYNLYPSLYNVQERSRWCLYVYNI